MVSEELLKRINEMIEEGYSDFDIAKMVEDNGYSLQEEKTAVEFFGMLIKIRTKK